MELLDRGKHCDEEFCHQLDYLPIKCKACSKSFCKFHIKYDDHSCKEALKFDYKIPTCPLCNQTVEFQRGKDLDICLAEHMQNCEEEASLNKRLKDVTLKKVNNASKCMIPNCRSKKDIIKFDCQRCKKSFCVKHRMQEDHECSALKSASQHAAGNRIFKTCSQQHQATTSAQGTNSFTVKNY